MTNEQRAEMRQYLANLKALMESANPGIFRFDVNFAYNQSGPGTVHITTSMPFSDGTGMDTRVQQVPFGTLPAAEVAE